MLSRGTTPKLTFVNASSLDLSTLTEIWFTIKQKSSGIENTFSLSDGRVVVDSEANTLTVCMTQEETLSYNPDNVEIQIRCVDENELAYVSDIFTEHMDRIVKGGVISAPKETD